MVVLIVFSYWPLMMTSQRSNLLLPTMLAASLFLSACAPTIVSRSESLPFLKFAERWDGATCRLRKQVTQTQYVLARIHFSPTLRGLIETALSNNRDLQVALLRVEEARATYAIQRSDLFPAIDAGGQATRGRTPWTVGSVKQLQQVIIVWMWVLAVGSWICGAALATLKSSAQEYLATEQAQRAVRSTLIAEVSASTS